MSAMSNYLEDQILNHLFRATTIFTAPANVYISLHTADPTDAASGAEVSTSGTGYVRLAVSTTAQWDAPIDDGAGAQMTKNTNILTFATPTASWGIVTHFGIWSAVSGGNLLVYGILSASKTIGTSDTVQFAATDLKIKMA